MRFNGFNLGYNLYLDVSSHSPDLISPDKAVICNSQPLEMEGTIQIHIEKLPEGLYLATSDDIQGLVAQGRTITKTLEIARDIVKKLIEAQSENGGNVRKLGDNFDYPLVIGI